MPAKKARTFSYEDEGKYIVKQTTGKNARTSKNVFAGVEGNDKAKFASTGASSRDEHDYLRSNKNSVAAKKNASTEKRARSKAPSTGNASKKK